MGMLDTYLHLIGLTMNKLQIDIVSDVMCPWCIVGYKGLESALNKLELDAEVEINWLPFELNPQMPPEGQDMQEHIIEKYGITAQQSAENKKQITQRGKEVGFDFNFSTDLRMINSFNLHRLLSWAKEFDKQHALKMALFDAHFTDNIPLNNNENLLKIASSVGLDLAEAKNLLDSDAYTEQVRAEQNRSIEMGISSVPTFIINNKYSISGGQPPDAFKQALMQIMQEG